MDCERSEEIQDEKIHILIRQGQEYLEKSNNSLNQALELLVRKHANTVHAFCSNILLYSGIDNAQDVVQDIFIEIRENILSFRGKNIITWMYSIARNKCIDFIRNERKKVFLNKETNKRGKTNKDIDNYHANDKIRSAISEMSIEDQVALSLRHLHGFSSKDIAEILNIKPQTLNVRLSRAAKRLREKMETD